MDRTGIRTEAVAEMAHSLELASGPACVGAIQVTPDGTLILLGPDGPTIGGYPKIGAVASVDQGRMGQLRPGDEIRFEEVSAEEARRLRVEADKDLEAKLRLLRS
jgi:antagonist of KipI